LLNKDSIPLHVVNVKQIEVILYVVREVVEHIMFFSTNREIKHEQLRCSSICLSKDKLKVSRGLKCRSKRFWP